MKQFGKKTILLVLVTMSLLFLFDFVYTQIYTRTIPRNKLQYILKTRNNCFDVVFLGSSRVANHIDIELFDSLSGKKTINLGVEGAGLNDNLLQLKLLLANNNHVSNLFLQLDNNYERTVPSNIVSTDAMPFSDNDIIKNHLKQYLKNNNELLSIPFYRYAINDPKIGFRELFVSFIGKKPQINPAVGFIPKFGNSIPFAESSLPKTIRDKNDILDEIIAICSRNNIKIILFTTPFCNKMKRNGYIEKLKIKFPALLDLSKGYDDTFFYNCGHLNVKGARVLTDSLYIRTKKIL